MTNGIVDYTGKEVRNKKVVNGAVEITISFENGLTLAQYENEKNQKFCVASNLEIDKLFKDYENSFNNKPFKEIKEDRFFYCFECLPPVRYTNFDRKNSFFFISEAYTGSLHSLFVNINGKYYEALRDLKTPTVDLINNIKNMIK